MFPILATVHFYRLFHLAHHQYTNDPERDPDLVTLGASKMVERFPMGRWEFIKATSFGCSPNLWRSSGSSRTTSTSTCWAGRRTSIFARSPGARGPGRSGRARDRAGVGLPVAFLVLGWVITSAGRPEWLIPAGCSARCWLCRSARALPDGPFSSRPFASRIRGGSGVMRLAFYHVVLRRAGPAAGGDGRAATLYFCALDPPSGDDVPVLHAPRDIYQHTNADDGRLTNTRVFFIDPLTRWAVFVYGQDMHVPHHLFPADSPPPPGPAAPAAQARHADYAPVVECHGTFANATASRPSSTP